ncbi:MAG: hypothetical protein AB7H80_15050 [Candidatus Kapaibacterium sp.]
MNAGIWLDQRKAYLILLTDHQVTTTEIESGVEEYHLHGGYGGPDKHLGQDASSETTLLARRKQQSKRYYQEIMSKLPVIEELYVFGPGEAKTHFADALKTDHQLKHVQLTVEAADSMTPNQMQAAVRDFFKKT